MRRIATTAAALALIAGLGLSATPAAAQQVTRAVAVYGQNWNMGQDLASQEAMTRVSPLARDRAIRAARQARYNRHYPGTPIRRVAAAH